MGPKRGFHVIGPNKTKRRKTAAEKTDDHVDNHVRRLVDYPERCSFVELEAEAEGGTQFEELFFDGKSSELVRCLRADCQTLPMESRLLKKTKPHVKRGLNAHEREHSQIDNRLNANVEKENSGSDGEPQSDYKFKKAGPGQRLDDAGPSRQPAQKPPSTSSSASSQHSQRSVENIRARNNAAEAALARMQGKAGSSKSGVNPNTMRRAREEAQKAREQQNNEKQFVDSLQKPAEQKVEMTKKQSVDGVYYICPISGDIIKKSEYTDHLELQLECLTESAPLECSVFKIHCLNTHRETRDDAIRLLKKIMENIINNPDEEKYRKLKVSGKAVKDKIAPQKGAIEFLKAIGWEDLTVDGELFYVFNGGIEQLQGGVEALETTDLPKPKLHRNPKVLEPQEGQSRITVPDDFYRMSGAEFKMVHNQQQIQKKQDDMLMTKQMRLDAQAKSNKSYNYTLIRVRFPNSSYLQGTFNAYEKGIELMTFVREQLNSHFSWIPFTIKLACGTVLTIESEEATSKTMSELGLVPGATVTLCITEDIRSELPSDANFLKEI